MSILKTNQIQNLTGQKILGNVGSIMQVISTTVTATFTTTTVISTSGGGAAVTNLSASITPSSATNKIFIMVQLDIMGQAATTQAYAYIARGSTPVGAGVVESARPGVGGRFYLNDASVMGQINMQYLDSPNTTTATVYNVYVGTETASGTVYVNRTQNDSNALNGARGSSSITVMEIAA